MYSHEQDLLFFHVCPNLGIGREGGKGKIRSG